MFGKIVVAKVKKRLCDDTYYGINSLNCQSLKASDTSKKCFYLGKKCIEYYETCESYKGTNKTICESIKPLKNDKTDFDYTKNCTFDGSSSKCQTINIMCTDYIIEDEKDYAKCNSLDVEDTSRKHCVYDFEKKRCKEEYTSCSTYNGLATKTKEICQNITLVGNDLYKKCVFVGDTCKEESKKCSDYKSSEPKEYCTKIPLTNPKICKYVDSKCIEDYEDCTSYTGNDKETCESIKVDGHKCALEKDESCETRALTCSEATTAIQCQSAKAEDSGKQCLFISGQCIEEYKTCENYLGYYKAECQSIIQINGKKCLYQSPQCQSYDKECSEGLIAQECSSIKRISDPDKKICTYDTSTGKCFENYKYCNDYKGSDEKICTKIKPYNSGGTNIDVKYKCVYTEKIGCERKPLECSEAKTSELCTSISGVLKDSKKYCIFIDGVCSEQYKTCGDYSKDVQKEICQAIIPNNYITHHCVFGATGDTNICNEVQNECESLKVDDYEYQCKTINPFCSYSEGICSKVERTCTELIFYSADDSNEKYCKEIKFDDSNKTCILSSDKLKCEIKDTSASQTNNQESNSSGDSTNSNTNTQNNQNTNSQTDSSSGLLKLKGIELIIILLNLLF